MENSKRPRSAGRILRAVGVAAVSTWTGLVLAGLLIFYLAAASLISPKSQGLLTGSGGLYAAWPLKTLLALAVLNVICATIVRVRLSLANLGLWCAHLGVVVLAVGAWWYNARAVSGVAVACRDEQSGLFIPVDRFFLEEKGSGNFFPIDRFVVKELRQPTFPGSDLPSDYVTSLAILGPCGEEIDQVECRLNHPAEIGRFRLYHRQWRGDPASPSDVVFLVTTRPGLRFVWLGIALICAGIPYTFYVKPVLVCLQSGRSGT